MKICASIAFLIIGACARGQSARSFFQELYDAGGLDQLASRYVCFPDDGNVRNFWVFNETKLLRKSLIDDGTFSKLPKGVQTELQRDSLIFRGYANGVPLPNQEFLCRERLPLLLGQRKVHDRKDQRSVAIWPFVGDA
jgi:hypothetical protein